MAERDLKSQPGLELGKESLRLRRFPFYASAGRSNGRTWTWNLFALGGFVANGEAMGDDVSCTLEAIDAARVKVLGELRDQLAEMGGAT